MCSGPCARVALELSAFATLDRRLSCRFSVFGRFSPDEGIFACKTLLHRSPPQRSQACSTTITPHRKADTRRLELAVSAEGTASYACAYDSELQVRSAVNLGLRSQARLDLRTDRRTTWTPTMSCRCPKVSLDPFAHASRQGCHRSTHCTERSISQRRCRNS